MPDWGLGGGGLGFGVWGLVQGLKVRVQSLRFRV